MQGCSNFSLSGDSKSQGRVGACPDRAGKCCDFALGFGEMPQRTAAVKASPDPTVENVNSSINCNLNCRIDTGRVAERSESKQVDCRWQSHHNLGYEQMRPLRYPPPHRRKHVSKSDNYNDLPLKISPSAPRVGYIGEGVCPRGSARLNASPMPFSLVTFLYGHKKVTPIIQFNCSIN